MSDLTDEKVRHCANPGSDLRLINRRMISRLAKEILALREELNSLRRFKAGVDAALNTGDGTYRP